MKKRFFLAALLVAALVFGTISCTKEETKVVYPGQCWKVTITVEAAGQTDTKECYTWGTAEDVDAAIAEQKAKIEAMGATFTSSKEAATQFTTLEDCLAQNPK